MSSPLRTWRHSVALVLGALLSGPAATAMPTAPPAAQPGAIAADPACAAALGNADAQRRQLHQQARQLAVLLLGEVHTSAADHAWQLATLEQLRRQRQLVLALEMIPAARQPVLDRFNRGELNETELLQAVDWPAVWGHDAALYTPLLRWARLHQVPLLALNAEPELVRRVRRQGWAALPAGERQGIGDPAAPGPAYRQRLEQSWRGHGSSNTGGTGDSAAAADLQRFIDSQLVRDRAMAEQLLAAHRRDPGRLLVALVGVGHLQGGDGIPQQLQALSLRQQLSLVRPPLPAGCSAPPAGARLGAFLESDASGVWVRQVAPGSAAAAAGLRPGDRIVDLDGRAVQRAGQVIRGVRLHPGTRPLPLTIERQGRRLQLQLRLPPAVSPASRPGTMAATAAPAAACLHPCLASSSP